MIKDLVILNNELDILELRFKYLSTVVDKFIVCESNYTFSGKTKPYNLEINWSRFSKWHDKIQYIQIEQDPCMYKFISVEGYTPGNGPWLMEYEMRNGLAHSYSTIQPDDICLLGDVDEIVNKDIIRWYRDANKYEELSVFMNFHAFFFNIKNTKGPDCLWGGTKILRGSDLVKHSPQSIRDRRNSSPHIVSENSYHLSWMGGTEAIKNKIQSFAHTEFNKPEILDGIDEAVSKGVDVLHRPGVVYERVELEHFPADIANIMLDYPHLIK